VVFLILSTSPGNEAACGRSVGGDVGCRGPIGGHCRGGGHRDQSEGAGTHDQARTEDQGAGFRTLLLPSWAVEMLRLRPPGRPDQTVFCSALGGLRDRDNALGDLRNALNAAGFEWVTSHTFRRTVTTLMDQSGLTARAAADQLGHSHPSLTQDVYYGRRIANTGAADVLEVFG